jgi:hypothetical protein
LRRNGGVRLCLRAGKRRYSQTSDSRSKIAKQFLNLK